MVRKITMPSSSNPSPSNQLAIVNPPISKPTHPSAPKKKCTEIFYVRADSSGRHYGCTSFNPKRIILASCSVSRADGDLEMDTPPNSPSRDSTSFFTAAKPYVVNTPIRFIKANDKNRYESLMAKGKWPIPLLYPDRDDLYKLDMYDEIRSLLSDTGLGFIFKDDPGSYHPMTMEFLCSFRPSIKAEEGDTTTVKSWRFQLGGKLWEVDAEVLYDWFRFPRDGTTMDFGDKEVYEFWKSISGGDYLGEANHKSTSIRVPRWKLVHKFLGGVVFVRTSYGRLVSKMEIKLMMMIKLGVHIDWLAFITKGIIENQSDTSKNLGLGGGSFVTWVATKLGYTFEGMECSRERLHLKMMRSRHLLGKGLTWKNVAPEGVVREEEHHGLSDEDNVARPTDIPSSSTRPLPSSHPSPFSVPTLESKMDLVLDSLKTIANDQRILTSFVVDHLQWGERTLATIVSHLDLASKVDPPPVSPYDTNPPRSAPRSTKGKEKVGEEVAPSVATTPSEENTEDTMARYAIVPHRDDNFGVSLDDLEAIVEEEDDEATPSDKGTEYITASPRSTTP